MKKILLSCLFLVAFLLPLTTTAQNELTVCRGTTTNEYVPVYGYYADSYLRMQMIYPEDSLQDLVGALITQLTWYIDEPADDSWGSNFVVKMGTTSNGTLSDFDNTTTTTTVYSGLLDGTGSTMTVSLDEAFSYDGDNLLIEIYSTTMDNYSDCYFLGCAASGRSIMALNDDTYPIVNRISADDSYLVNFLPKLKFTYTVGSINCSKPGVITVSDISNDGATLTWGSSATASSYLVSVGEDEYITSDTSYYLSGLDLATTYNVSIYALCGGDTSFARTTSFRTRAGDPLTIPMFCDFTSAQGWDFANGTQTNKWFIDSTLYISSDNGATNSYNISSSSTVYAYCAVDFQQAGAYTCSFDWKSQGESQYYDYLRVFLVSDDVTLTAGMLPNGYTSCYDFYNATVPGWIALDGGHSLSLNSTMQNQFAEFTIDSMGIYKLVFVWANDGSVGNQPPAMVDNIAISQLSCPSISDLGARNLTTTSAEIFWTEEGTATNWVVAYDTVNFVPGTGEGFMETASDTTITLENLEPGQTYYVYVHADCGGGDTSNNRMVTFRLPNADPVSEFPYMCDFTQGTGNGWELVNGSQTNKWFLGSAAAYGSAGDSALYISNDNGSSNSYSTASSSVVYAYRDINFTTGQYNLQYNWKCNGESSFDYLRVYLAPINVEFTPGTLYSGISTSGSPSGWIALDGNNKLNLQSTWQTYSSTFNITDGSYHLVFVWRNDGSSGSTPPAAVDNLELVQITCPSVSNLQVTNVTSEEITVTWTPVGEEDTWIVAINNGEEEVTYNSSYTFTGLTPSSPYTITVKALCGGYDTSLVATIQARTACVEIVTFPWVENFNSEANNSLVACWDNSGSTTSTVTGSSYYVWGVYEYNGEKMLRMYNYLVQSGVALINTPVLILPDEGDSYDLSFNYSHLANTDSLYVKVSNNGGASFTTLAAYGQTGSTNSSDPGTMSEAVINLDSYLGDSILIQFSNYANYGSGALFLDDVSVHVHSDCVRPLSVLAQPASATSFTVTIIDTLGVGSYELAYSTDNQLESAETMTIYDTVETITSLNSGTTYYVWVRSDCGSEFSDWRGPVAVTPGVYQMGTSGSDTLRICGALITDNGGVTGSYTNNINSTLVVYPDQPGYGIRFYGTSYTESSADYLKIYDGVGTSGTLLWSDPTTSTLATIDTTYAESGPITLLFHTDGSVVYDGFALHVECYELPACPKPINLRSTGSTTTSVTIAWEENGTATSWEVAYGSPTADLTDPVAVSSTNFTATGLTGGSSYEFYVRSECGGGDYSMWAGPITVVPGTWVMQANSNDTISICGGIIYDDGGANGNYSNNVNSTLVVYSDQPGYGIRFYGTSYTESSIDYLKIYDGEGTSGTLLWSDPTSSTLATIDTTYSESGPITLVFHTDGSVVYQGFALHVECYELPTCPKPINLRSTGNTSSSISIAWQENGTATDWEVAYGTPEADFLNPVAVTTTNYTATGLAAGSSYKFYVRSVCGAGDTSDWAGPIVVTPGTWIMRANQRDTVSMCGGVIYDDGGPTGTYTNNQNSYLVVLPDTPSQVVSISGTAVIEGYTYDNLIIYDGIGTSGTVLVNLAGSSFTSGTTVSAMSEDPTGALTIYFKTDGSGVYSGYELFVSCASNTCPKPAVIDAVCGTSTIAVSWIDTVPGMGWEVEYGEAGFPQGTGTTAFVASPNYTATGLDALTSYDFYVRHICSTTDTGSWKKATFATTICDGAQVVEVADDSDYDSYAPHVPYYSYSYVQQIMGSEEMNGPADIAAVSFNLKSSSLQRSDITIYMGHTTQADFSSEYDTIAFANLEEVYSGTFDFVQGWNTVMLDSPFSYNGTDNFVIAIHDATGSWVSTDYYGSSISSYSTLSLYSDDIDPDPTSASAMNAFYQGIEDWDAYADILDWRANMRFISCGSGCAMPTIINTTNDYNSFTATWSGASDSYEVSHMSSSDADFSTPVVVNAHTYTLTSLVPATQYSFRVRSVCDSGATSQWAYVNFTTDSLPCFAPEDLHVLSTGYNTVTLDWSNGGNEQHWVVKVYNSRIGEILDTVSAHPATISGMTANESYFATVQAACGSTLDGFSDWSDTISFTTTECVPVSNVSCGTVTEVSVTVSWTSNGDENAWVVEYGLPSFGQGEEIGRVVSTTNPYLLQLAGLDPNSDYEVYVYAQCAEGLNSIPAGPATFHTGSIGISGVEGNADINIYPNPTSGATTISVSGISGEVTIDIVDMNGRTISSTTQQINDSTKVNVEGLAQGAYFVRIYGEEISTIRKLIVR